MSADNESCLAWLDEALRRLRAEGRTRVAGYPEAVRDEVLFETKVDPSAANYPAEGAS